MTALTSASQYDRWTIRLHWLTAALVALLWTIAQLIDDFPRGSPRIAARSVHILLGLALLAVLAARIHWRLRRGARLPAAEPGKLGQGSKAVHLLLYAGLCATLLLGLANVWLRGDSILGLFSVPRFPAGGSGLRRLVAVLHAKCADALVIVSLLHAVAAFAHHLIWHDGVLRRMWPARPRAPYGG